MWKLSFVLANTVNQNHYVILRGSKEIGAAIEDLMDAGMVAPIVCLLGSLPQPLQKPDTSWGTVAGHGKSGRWQPQLRHSCCASCGVSHTCSVAFEMVSYFFLYP